MKIYLFFASALLLTPFKLFSLNLYDLDPYEEYLSSGKKLMKLEFGLHDLESQERSKEILIAIHGRDSRGFEWIYPLQTIDNNKTKTYFLRWDTTKCPQKAIPDLMKEISEIENVEKITILGHSYGGILSSLLLNEIEIIDTDIHVIAAPLASTDLKKYCGYIHPTTKNTNISYHQWRTIKKFDFAFSSLNYDPQIIEFEGSSVTRLPQQYNGKRLGHLWSISWVAENIEMSR